jgi:O-antigen/teichoic acid export membrane protein
VRPHAVRPLLRHRLAAETMDMGRTVFFTNIVNWLLTNVDRLLIGRMLNAHAVGLFSVAYNIASIPNTLLIGALQPTFLATGARLQNDPRQLGRAWITMLSCILVLITPVSIVMALLAGDLVQVLYGPAWQDAGWVMAVLFFCVPAWACWGLSTPVLWNTGRKHQEVLLQLPVLAVAVPLWWYFAPQGIRAIAVASAAVIFARAVVVVIASLRAVQLRPSVLLPFLGRGLALGVLCAVTVLAGREAAASLHHPVFTLLGGGALATVVAFALVALRPQVLGPEARAVLSRVIPAIGPRWPAATPEAHP